MKRVFFSYQFLATVTSSLAVLSSGIHEAWTSVYIPVLLNGTNTLKITSVEGSWITMSMSFGGLIGCVVSCLLINKIGRKKTILLTFCPNFLSSVVLAFANSVPVFCTARVLSGVAFGIAIGVIPHYIGEIADPEIRGSLGTLVTIFSLSGFLFINIVGSYVTIQTSSWISATIPVLFLLTFIWMPESPYYLVMIGECDQAEQTLAKLKGTRDVFDEFQNLKESLVTQIIHKTNVTEIFRQKSNRKALLIIFILLNGKQMTGISPLDAYAQLIFQKIFPQLSPLSIILVYYLTRLFLAIVSSFLSRKIGRRPLLLISFFGCSITLFLLAFYLHLQSLNMIKAQYFSILPILFLEAFAVFYSFLTPVPLSILGELFPMNVKTFASIFYEVYLYLVTLFVIKLFQEVSDHYGIETPFFIFATLTLIHTILIYKFVFETKGKTLYEIQKCLE
ncbi:facilitated trehalose transporter Tret1-like [Tribolium castaneum]|uniref:facilitated trehalose transporter Tret1-like n=1 Tax=Tribolium castaneum TaxID=7070 RepID=UPI0000D56864|nr:PREDICTED: facilitated trehalose transporter Tret1-like [Tribolium castaneum]|eukprot:XP_015836891.1 PREDICTED: facilitated trehalose transporter Tret1-like [Tribolium castaneum]